MTEPAYFHPHLNEPEYVRKLRAQVVALTTERDDIKTKFEQLRRHIMDESSDAFRQLHAQAVAHLDAVAALSEVRNGHPLSTTIGWLIRQGYLVPADPAPSTVSP